MITHDEAKANLRAWHAKGPSTYLHAGSSKGWPADQKSEDTFEVPSEQRTVSPWDASAPWHPTTHFRDGTPIPMVTVDTRAPAPVTEEREYRAEFGDSGEAFLVLDHTKRIAKFDTYADAQTAAEALNNLKGY